MLQSRPHLLSARPSSPVHLPTEIYLLIGLYLTGSDLTASARASKEWNVIFSPFLYKSLGLYASLKRCPYGLDFNDSLHKLIRATLATRDHDQSHGMLCSDSLVRYGSCIKYLAIKQSLDFKKDTFAAISSLRGLSIVARDWKENWSRSWDVLLESSKVPIIVNQTIQTLELSHLDLRGTLSWIAHECPILERLRLKVVYFTLLDMAQIFRACRSLLYLSVDASTIRASKKGQKLFRDRSLICDLRELELCFYDYDVLPLFELLSCFPRLKSILIREDQAYPDPQVQLDCCKELSKITIESSPDLPSILDRYPSSVTDISIKDIRIGSTDFASLRPRFKFLTSMRFNGVNWKPVEGSGWKLDLSSTAFKMAAEIIRSCPNLVHLECPILHGFLASPSEMNEGLAVNQQINPSLWGDYPLKLKTLKVIVLVLYSEVSDYVAPLFILSSLETVSCAQMTSYFDSELPHHATFAFDHCPKGQFKRSELAQILQLKWSLETWPTLTSFTNEGQYVFEGSHLM